MAMSLPSSMPTSSSIPRWSHDVFLSFRGIDTRKTFVAYLYDALCRKGINTYIDDKDLERGESISPTLFKTIEESMISIVVFSPNYASSPWCLEELTKILECKKTKEQIVLPIFYHVDPSKIRKCRGRFGKALANHQKRFKEDKVKSWKASLKEVANLAGEHLKDGNELEFIHKIIIWVDSKIVRSSYMLDIAEYPIGVKPRVEHLNALLRIGRNDINLMIGIYGIGGIGKTTIAKAVYNSIAHQFEARCFLPNVKDSSSEDGLVKMQKRLLEALLGNSISFSGGSAGGISAIKERLHSKRIILILDDITELSQLQKLAGDRNWFGLGSRIIITTRDKHVLACHGVHSTYEVQGLDDNQAIQLFSWHAFKKGKPGERYVQLTNRIIGYANGLPLALRVLGSNLHGKSVHEWESELEKYERSLDKNIYEILRISYDGLDDNEKDIFLDIACFFKGMNLNYVKEILDHFGFSSTIGIKRLRDKCLIGKFNSELNMHDLLQEMGREIVRQESPKETGERIRLWLYEDVLHVLEENTGTNKVEAILLDLPENHDEKIVRLHSEAFNPMKNLRMLINCNAEFSTGPNYLSNELRVLDWPNYPSPFLPSNFYGKKLTIFKITGGLIKELGGLKAKNLTRMDLHECKFLTRIPDLSSSPNLKHLDLKYCENLVEIHHSVGFLGKLLALFAIGCFKLKIFPKRLKLRSLWCLELTDCWSLEDVPEIESEMALSSIGNFLPYLSINLRNTSIKELPSSIGNLAQLTELHLNDTYIKELPSSIGNLTQLQRLYLDRSSIIELPSSIGNITLLGVICARDCKNLVHLPSSISQLESLKSFLLDGCSQPINIGKVEDGTLSTTSVVPTGEREIASTSELNPINDIDWDDLKTLSLDFCCLLQSNFFVNNYFRNFECLNLSGSDIVVFPQSGVRFDMLRILRLNNCKHLKEIRPLPSSIKVVEARGCTSLESFAELSEIVFKNNATRSFVGLVSIDLYGCHKLGVDMGLPSREQL